MEVDLFRIKNGRRDVRYFPPHDKLYLENKNSHDEEKKKGLCFLCKKPGHLQFNCPNRKRPKNVNTIKKSTNNNESNLPSATLRRIRRIEKYEDVFRALIDSGSDHNFIQPEFAKANNIKLENIKESFKVTGLGYGVSTVKKQTEKCILRLRNHFEIIQLYSLRIPDVDIILGIPWIDKHCPSNYHDSKKISFSSGYCANHCNQGRRKRRNINKYKKKNSSKGKEIVLEDDNTPTIGSNA
eukprot:jgi/Orpsp1_1/1191043/evm.model.d7180000083108.1